MTRWRLLNKILYNSFWLAGALLLALGCTKLQTGYRVGVVVCYTLAWILLGKKYSSACLVLSILIAAAGMLLKAEALFMFAGVCVSLAAWDLASLNQWPAGNITADKSSCENSIRYRRQRLKVLFFTLIAGFPIIFLGRLISFHIPFFIMLIIVCLAFISIERLLHFLKQKE